MAIIRTITNDYEFWEWLKQSDSYKDNFSVEGALAVQEYYEELSKSMDKDVEFDPVAWCCTFSEYDSYDEVWQEVGGGGEFIEGEEIAINENIKIWLDNNTYYKELDNDNILVEDF
ncbi:hypothetical protein EKK58_09475 [Candidatus Dependentiae bacterium]|nr:MAG: hypothetical protein EKK58_09475 [Candidatus Dependentiae bacterium]